MLKINIISILITFDTVQQTLFRLNIAYKSGKHLMYKSVTDDSQDNLFILQTIASLKDQPGALLPILHEIQQLVNYIPETAIPLIADALNLSRADVHGVVSFYHHFRQTKPGEYVIQLCRAESCQSMGASILEQHARQTLGIDYHQTTDDGLFSLEPVYCLGNCACSPSIRIADEIYSDMNTQKFDKLLNSILSKQKRGKAYE